MNKFETEYEKAWREFDEAKKDMMNALIENKLGKFFIDVLDWMNNLLNKA